MRIAYDVFCSEFNVPAKNVILGNGCENIIKNILLGIHTTCLVWSKPAWKFIDVYCSQLDITPMCLDFSYNQHNRFAYEPNVMNNNDIFDYYNTYYANNLLYTSINSSNEQKSRYSIIDISYADMQMIYDIMSNFNYNGKRIIVGSFDKLCGCGIRIGFAIFPNRLSEQI